MRLPRDATNQRPVEPAFFILAFRTSEALPQSTRQRPPAATAEFSDAWVCEEAGSLLGFRLFFWLQISTVINLASFRVIKPKR